MNLFNKLGNILRQTVETIAEAPVEFGKGFVKGSKIDKLFEPEKKKESSSNEDNKEESK